MDRSYRDESGQYQSTQYLRDSDLLRAQKLLDEADAWIEQDKIKHRSGVKSSESRLGRGRLSRGRPGGGGWPR
jgi:hypothetical protein